MGLFHGDDREGTCPFSGRKPEKETDKKVEEMGSASAKEVEKIAAPPAPAKAEEKPKLKPCCACPETKKVRDACIIERGEENCGHLIEEHKACMRKLGFKI